jgi:hypothetical protein
MTPLGLGLAQGWPEGANPEAKQDRLDLVLDPSLFGDQVSPLAVLVALHPPVLVGNSNSDVAVVQSAKDWQAKHAACSLDVAWNRGILIQRQVHPSNSSRPSSR